MSECERATELLDAFHDGELGLLARWRMRWHVQRCASCQHEVERLGQVGEWVRGAAGLEEGPDLWSQIAAHLPALDRALDTQIQAPPAPARRWVPSLVMPVGVGVAAASLVLFLASLQATAPVSAPRMGMVRTLYAMEEPVIVLEDSAESTIIWVMDPPTDQRSEGGPHGLG